MNYFEHHVIHTKKTWTSLGMIKKVLEKAKFWHKGVASHSGVYSFLKNSLIEHSWIHYIVGPYGSVLESKMKHLNIYKQIMLNAEIGFPILNMIIYEQNYVPTIL